MKTSTWSVLGNRHGDLGVAGDHDLVAVPAGVGVDGQDAQGMGVHVGDVDVADPVVVAAVEGGHDGRSLRHREIGVAVGDDGLEAVLLEVPLDLGEPGGPSAEQHLVDLFRFHAGALEHVVEDVVDGVDEVVGGGFEVLHAELVPADVVAEGDVGGGPAVVDERFLVVLAVREQLVALPDVGAGVLPELVVEPLADVVEERLVPVLAAEVVVAAGAPDIDGPVADVHYGDVERTASEVVHEDVLALGVLVAVVDGGGGRFVDDLGYGDAGALGGGPGGRPLQVVEISGYGDDGALDLLSGLLLRLPHELLEHHAGELLRGVRPAVQFGAGGVGAHADLEDGGDASSPAPLHVLGIVADEDRAVVHEADDGRSEVLLVLVADDVRPGSFSVIPGNGGVRRPEVDTDPHLCIPFGCIISY